MAKSEEQNGVTVVHVKIEGTAPYSQSQRVDQFETKKEDESHDDFEQRTWKLKAHVGLDGDSISIPAHAFVQALELGASTGRLVPKAAASKAERLAKRLSKGCCGCSRNGRGGPPRWILPYSIRR
jgi:hypothetical protein